MDNEVDRDDVIWMLETIWQAGKANAGADRSEDWNGVAAAAHMCLHYLGPGCTMLNCSGLEMNAFLEFARRYQ